ncbi:MAG: tRNA lysidine(34) synthetase TilS [Coprobacillus cateniformis]
MLHLGELKISRLYIDNKVPKSQRENWPIVVNSNNEIILVPHLAKILGIYIQT